MTENLDDAQPSTCLMCERLKFYKVVSSVLGYPIREDDLLDEIADLSHLHPCATPQGSCCTAWAMPNNRGDL